jgi:hypothetical protein
MSKPQVLCHIYAVTMSFDCNEHCTYAALIPHYVDCLVAWYLQVIEHGEGGVEYRLVLTGDRAW